MSATQSPASLQQFRVKWNSHLGSLGAAFPQLLAGQRFVDVTLACQGHQLHCHRLVLAACSSYFESLLSENPCEHPIIIMPLDIKLWEMQALVDFMYKGEVNVSQHGLANLLRCADILQVRGLCGDAAVNVNSVTSQAPYNDSNVPYTIANADGSSPTSFQTQPTHTVTPPVISLPLSSTTTTSAISTFASATALINNVTNFIAANQKIANSHINEASSNPIGQSIGTAAATANGSKRAMIAQDIPTVSNNSRSNTPNLPTKLTVQQQSYTTSTPNNTVTPKLEPVDISIEENSSNAVDISKVEGEEPDYMDSSEKPPNDFALANVICEYDGGLQINMDNVPGRRVRRSEAILTQAAECVSKGQTFQTVSDMFNIPISTIRFFMARKGILPRRKRGRAAGVSIIGQSDCNNMNIDHSRSVSPLEPPFHFANYKLPEIKPRLL